MTMKAPSRRFVIAAGLTGCLLPGAAFPQSQEREVEGGIGGTGIVGVLVGFGSLILAGHRIDVDANTTYENALGSVREQDIQVGDALTVEAATTRTGGLVARRVHVTHPLIGTVSTRSVDGRRITVNGIEVTSDQMVPFGSGSRVAVSGLWRGQQVVASRIAPAPGSQDVLSGTVDRRGFVTRISGIRVTGPGLNAARSGGFAATVGEFDPSSGRMIGTRTTLERFTDAAGPLRRLSVEGWIEPTNRAPGFRVAGLGHSFARNLQLDGLQNQRLLLRGGYDGLFGVQTAVRLPDDAASRRSVLIDLIP